MAWKPQFSNKMKCTYVLWAIKIHKDVHDETAVCKNVATPPLCSYLAKLAAQLLLPHTTIILWNYFCSYILWCTKHHHLRANVEFNIRMGHYFFCWKIMDENGRKGESNVTGLGSHKESFLEWRSRYIVKLPAQEYCIHDGISR